MRKNILKHLLLFAFPFLILTSYAAQAEYKGDLFKNSCSSFSSNEDFMKQAGVFCVNQTHTRTCMRQARSYFKQCGYEGNFKELMQGVQEKLLVMLFITKSTDMAKHL